MNSAAFQKARADVGLPMVRVHVAQKVAQTPFGGANVGWGITPPNGPR
ncbi:MAG TPA: hypothetical protein VGA59_10895 [Ramlibacter sp.]|jgi:hypothetical protein